MINFDKVSKRYAGTEADSLSRVSLSVKRGEFITVVGPSGAGKSTLFKLILGEEIPTDGSVFFEDDMVHNLSTSRLRQLRRRIGMVFQDYRLLPTRNAFENIAFAMEASGRPDNEIREIVPHMLDLVNLNGKEKRFPYDLSGGEQQRLAIARAIVNEPDLVLADEPTGNLDPVSSYEVIEILKKINEMGTTIILATHNFNMVKKLKNRMISLDQGKIINE